MNRLEIDIEYEGGSATGNSTRVPDQRRDSSPVMAAEGTPTCILRPLGLRCRRARSGFRGLSLVLVTIVRPQSRSSSSLGSTLAGLGGALAGLSLTRVRSLGELVGLIGKQELAAVELVQEKHLDALCSVALQSARPQEACMPSTRSVSVIECC